MGTLVVSTPGGKLTIRTPDQGADPDPDPGTLDATHNLTAGQATFGQVIPQGAVPAGSAIKVGSLDTQCDVKTTWPDGSARFAVLTCKPTTTGDQALSVVAADSGTFTPTIPTASVVLTIAGTAWTATLPGTVSVDLWLDGPLVKEWRTVVAPLNPSSTPHAFLRVYFDTRVYSDGSARVDVTVENCLDVATAVAVTYDLAVTVNGSSVYTRTAQPHYYLTRWRKVFGVGLTESTITFDFTPLHAAGAMPKFLGTSDSPTFDLTGANFDPMGRGNNSYDFMGATGGRPEIAPYPDWAAAYLVHQTANQRQTTLVNGDLAGSWPAHIRNTDGTLISIDDRPDFWLDTRGSDQPAGDMTTGAGPLQTDSAHVPSLAYLPYLMTGDRYHLEELAFWGNWSLIVTWPATTPTSGDLDNGGRGGDTGIVGVGQVRARGWCLRNLVDATAYLTDDHPSKGYLASKVATNLTYYEDYIAGHMPPLGTILEGDNFGQSTTVALSVWQQAYLSFAIRHAAKQGFATTLALPDRAAQFQLSLFTNESEWPRDKAGPYYPRVGISDLATHFTFYTTLTECYAASYQGADPLPDTPFVGNYGLEARLHLLLSVANGVAGASAALAYLMAQSGMPDYVNSRPGFAIDATDYP